MKPGYLLPGSIDRYHSRYYRMWQCDIVQRQLTYRLLKAIACDVLKELPAAVPSCPSRRHNPLKGSKPLKATYHPS